MPSAPVARATSPAGDDAAARLREAAAKLKLEVLVVDDQGANGLVFINGKKYVAGQTLEGTSIVVEKITGEGVLLGSQGQRYLLTPTHN